MDSKTIKIIIIATLLALLSSFAAIWFLVHGQPTKARRAADHAAKPAKAEEANLNSKVEIFNMILPCKNAADGSFPIVHADILAEVPIKYRLKVENSDSKLRDIISSIFREMDIAEINADFDRSVVKKRIRSKAKEMLDIEIVEILFLRFDYDIQPARKDL